MLNLSIVRTVEDEYGWWVGFACGCRALKIWGLGDKLPSLYVNFEDCRAAWEVLAEGTDFIAQMLSHDPDGEPVDWWEHHCPEAGARQAGARVKIHIDQHECAACGLKMGEE